MPMKTVSKYGILKYALDAHKTRPGDSFCMEFTDSIVSNCRLRYPHMFPRLQIVKIAKKMQRR
jgi:hypothetical protein